MSPTGNASSAFGIGSGAFAGFGSKTPKTTGGNPFEASLSAAVATAKTAAEKLGKDKSTAAPSPAPVNISTRTVQKGTKTLSTASTKGHLLSHKWVFWFRPPITKAHGFIEYEKTLHPMACVSTVEEFWTVYRHLKRPSELPAVSDYHLFKDGIRPIWEDDINKQGGKWVVRLKKGVADRYWEELLMAMVGGQFDSQDMSDVCGVVLSVRNGEDIISIWTKENGNRVLKIRYVLFRPFTYQGRKSNLTFDGREIMKKALNFPPGTIIDWKSHNDSLQQRAAAEETRREKAAARAEHSDKRGGLKPDSQRQSQ